MIQQEPQIADWRLSLAWHEAAIDQISTEGIFGLGPESYGEPGLDGAETSHFPWKSSGVDGFWSRYLDGRRPQSMTGTKAWQNLVPVRRTALGGLKLRTEESRVSAEILHFPWGWTTVVNIAGSRRIPLEALPAEIIQVNQERIFENVLERKVLTLSGLADRLLTEARKCRAPQLTAQNRPDPVTVFSVVRAQGKPSDFDLSLEPIQRLLHAATSLSEWWESETLTALEDARLPPRKHDPPGKTVYGSTRGRAIWIPNAFLASGRLHTVSCYHRNLLLASAQADALGTFISKTSLWMDDNRLLSEHRTAARRAAGILSRFYLGSKSTYRTASVQRQILQNGWLEPLNQLREEFGLTPLESQT